MNTENQLFDLIGLVYESAIEPNGWSELLLRISRLVQADTGLLGVGTHGRPPDEVGIPLLLKATPGQEPRWSAPLHPSWSRMFSARFDEGVLTGTQCSARHPLNDTRLYSDVLLDSEIENGLFAGIARSADTVAIAAFHRSRNRKRFGTREVDLLSMLLPHLRRASRLNDRFGLLESESAAARAAGDLVSIGIVYLDGHGHVLSANAYAERLFEQEGGLLIRQRKIRTSSQKDGVSLDAAIAMAREPKFPLTGQIVTQTGAPGGTRVVMYVAPVPRVIERSCLSGRRVAEVVLLITTTETLASWPIPVAAKALGLTPAEAELALALARGDDLQAHATSRGLSLETARWRMKQILQKTSSKRQSDVVRFVLTTLGRLVATGFESSLPLRRCGKSLEAEVPMGSRE